MRTLALLLLGCGSVTPDGGGSTETPTDSIAEAPESTPTARDASPHQRVLELAGLTTFWHEELPGRRPLRVLSNEHVPDDAELHLFGQPVTRIAAPDPEPYFVFTRADVSGDGAEIEFRYPVEGVRGSAVLTREAGSWRVVHSEVFEE